jgi:tetratricopeptide (TPR) repeat protein
MNTILIILGIIVSLYIIAIINDKFFLSDFEKMVYEAQAQYEISKKYYQKNNTQKQIFHLTNAINILPSFDYFKSRGLCYHTNKEYEKAIEDLTSALKVDSNDKVCLFFRAHCYYEIDKKDKAYLDWKKGARLGSVGSKNYLEKYQDEFIIYENPNEILRRNWIKNKTEEIFKFNSILHLINNEQINNIKYFDLLNCFEWQFKRFKILFRDKFKCVDCNELSERLHVHHTYYLKDALPWEIEDDGLVSLCKKCHRKRHDREIIKVYQKNDNRFNEVNYYFSICPRCNGTGHLPQFNHVENGICFLCFGNILPKTIFSERLNQINNNKNLYNENLNEFIEFTDNISIDYFEKFILNKIYFDKSKIEDLPF